MKKADPSYSRYYMHSANALAPEFEEEVVVRPQTVVRPQKKTKPHLKLTVANVLHLACAFVLAMALVGQYIYIQGLGYEERYAVSSLGMVQPGDNVAYLPERQQEAAADEVHEASEETVQKTSGGVVAMIEGIADRFGF